MGTPTLREAGAERALRAGAGALGLAWPASADTVCRAQDQGLRVMAHTWNEPTAVREAAAAGVDVIITDDPAMAQRTLTALPSVALTT